MDDKRIPFTNRWMFGRVVCNEGVCRKLIQTLLGIDVGAIDYLNAEDRERRRELYEEFGL